MATIVVYLPDYAILAARKAFCNLHKETSKSFSSTIKRLYTYVNPSTGQNPFIFQDVYKIASHAKILHNAIVHERDFTYEPFGFKTLERFYLFLKSMERLWNVLNMLMRVAVYINGDDLEAVLDSYQLMSEKWFTHTTATLFNAGTSYPQLSSCFINTFLPS